MKIYVEAGSVKENYLIGLARIILSTRNYPGKPFVYFSFIDDSHYGFIISTEKIDISGLYTGQKVYQLGPISLFADLLSGDKSKVEAAQAALTDTQAKLAASVKDKDIDNMQNMLAIRSANEISNLIFSLPLFGNIIKQLESGKPAANPNVKVTLVDSGAKLEASLESFLAGQVPGANSPLGPSSQSTSY